MSGQGFHYQRELNLHLIFQDSIGQADQTSSGDVLAPLNESKRDEEKLGRPQFVQIQIHELFASESRIWSVIAQH